ncbi:MAG: hypothetical protein GX061_07255, partial [Eubacteriaceae bacterium]|nr:hypothetical protein [Eubacteriaceae bacterium]
AWSVPGVANPIVHLKITGFKPGDDPATSPEKGILLYNGEVIGTSHTFTAEDIASWSYKNVVVEVTRQGIQGASGYTTSLGSKASKTIEVPLALPTVLRPLVLIDGRESLVYEIAWNAPADAQAVTDTANYGIYVNDALLHTTEGNANYTAKVDLGAYAGREIEVYVIANVKTSPAVYTASSRRSDLETAQITVMTRAALGSPSVTLPGFAYNDTPLSVPAFLEGPTITVQNSTTGLASGAYRFEACVCSVGTGSVLPTLDGGRLTDIFADTMTSSTPGSLAEATYKLEKLGGLPMERNYNAKYLWVRVRVEPEDSVYSEWSAWQIVRLAKIKLNTPSVVRTTENVTFEEINSASEENPPAITVPMTLLSFTWEEYAQKYEISIVENASGTSAEHEIILQRNNGAIQQGETPLPIVDGIYTLNDYMIPINVKVGTDEYEFEVPASVRISTSGTNTTVTLYLPDFDSFTLNVNNTTYTHIVHATQSVSITAIPDESTGGPSDPAIYNQVKVGNKYEWVMP